jgi:NAD(P)-dependent dehydrogenase (short-subunit alcohol dehydrogenase family)
MSDGRVALVTGGSRGIGRGICLALAREGWKVVVNYNSNIGAAEETLRAVEAIGAEVDMCQADVASATDRELLLQFCMEKMGRIDLLVNNAGVALEKRTDILETTEKSYDRVMDTNLKSCFFLTQQAARLMITQIEEKTIPTASIINISSVSAYSASPMRGEYCISKAGMTMVTLLFASRLAEYGIGVYEIRPGLIDTDMTDVVKDKYGKMIRDGIAPIKRWGTPEDIGKAAASIARGDFPFSTGEVFNVDGGFHIRRL